mgnify:FL=1
MHNPDASPQDNLVHSLKEIIAEIPFGHVATVEELTEAMELSKDKEDEVAWALKEISDDTVPTWRVVKDTGELLTPFGEGEWDEQKSMLAKEHVTFEDDTKVNVEEHFWSSSEYVRS